MACSSTTPLFKQVSMAETCLTSLPITLFSKTQHTFLSLPTRKPIKLSFSATNSSSSWVSFKNPKKLSSLNIIPLVAQTIDLAQQGEEDKEEIEGSGEESFGDGGEEESFSEPPEEAKLFVGNLPYDVESEKLAQLFNQAGVVEISEVIYNRETDQSRGFGFVTMSTVEEAEKAVEMFHQYDINGRLLTVNKAAPRGSQPERPRVYVEWHIHSRSFNMASPSIGTRN